MMQPRGLTGAFIPEQGLYDDGRGLAQAQDTYELQRVDSHLIRDAEKLASRMLEARLCVVFAGPAGALFLLFGGYVLIFEVMINGDSSSLTGGASGVLLGTVLLVACANFGRRGLSLHITRDAIYIRSLEFGFFAEKVFRVNHGALSGVEENEKLTLYYSTEKDGMVRIEAGISKSRFEEIMMKIQNVMTLRN